MCYYILLFATVALALFEPRYAESPLLLGVILYRRVRLRAVTPMGHRSYVDLDQDVVVRLSSWLRSP